MRILNVIATMNQADGGPIEWVRCISQVAPKLGHTSDVLTLDDPSENYLKDLPFACYALGKQNKHFYHSELSNWIKRQANDYDAVLAHGLWRYPSYGTWRALHNHDTPYFIYTHGMLGPWFKQKQPLKHMAKWCYWPWTDYRVLRDASAVFFTCEEEKRLASQSFWLYKANEIVASPGQFIPTEDLENQKKSFLIKFPRLSGKRIFLFLGRLVPIKGCDLLIKAFAKIALKNPNAVLVFAGNDPVSWQQELEQLARHHNLSSQVIFTGHLHDSIKWGAIHAAEVGVLPSHHENFSFSTVEFLAAGKPMLLTDKVGICQELIKNNCGLVAKDTESGIESLLTRWIGSSEAQKQQMCINAKNTYEQHFELRSAVGNLFDLMQANLGQESDKRVVNY